MLVDAHLKLNQKAKAREVLKQMEAWLAQSKPGDADNAQEKRNHIWNQVTYWKWMAALAKEENRKLDALAYYRHVLTVRPPVEKKEGKDQSDELVEPAQKLWKELGGTDEGWQLWAKREEAAKEAAVELSKGRWEKKNKPLTDFELGDLQGRTWRQMDLKGKVAFINVWATWCGPCQQELPYVQKLHERLKNRSDVVLLTLNLDSEIGLIEPYMKEKKFTFPVLPAFSYVSDMLGGMISIPRTWIIDANGVMQMEQVGFGGEGDKWLEQTLEMIQKTGTAK